MPSFSYKALTQDGEVVSGSILAASTAEVASRIEYLGLIPIGQVSEERSGRRRVLDLSLLSQPRPADVTVFTVDLALLLRTGARINEAIELLASDADIGRLRPTLARVAGSILAGESFADALAQHPKLFSPMYVALVRVGEASGALDHILEVLGAERIRSEALRRRLVDALRYPAFLLFAASAVLLFFLTFVLPQFASVLRDFNAKLDPVILTFFAVSDFLKQNIDVLALLLIAVIVGLWAALRRSRFRGWIADIMARLPLVSPIMSFHRTALFCRNLSLLLGSGVALTTSLRILADMMAASGRSSAWTRAAERVRQGGKLSDALAEEGALPTMAVRTLRLGEETGQLPVLAGRIAEFYESKLQRSLDRIVGIVGPLAIVIISIVIGGLIVSVMTALLSVNQVIG
jgi:general secretion pathway protein F